MDARRLVLIRHSKSVKGGVDIDRELTDRGQRDAAAVGEWLTHHQVIPDQVVVSPARRALRTWERAAQRLARRPPVVVDPRVYGNTAAELLDVIHDVNAGVGTLAIVGHNPSIESLALALDDAHGAVAAREQLAAGCATSAIVVFSCQLPFSEIRPGSATVRQFAAPRAI